MVVTSSLQAASKKKQDRDKDAQTQVDWQADPYWRARRLTPAQLLIHDIRLEGWKSASEPMMEIKEVLSSSLKPHLQNRERLESLDFEKFTTFRDEQHRFRTMARDYGWMNVLRSNKVQENISDSPETRKCRWIHISSKFPEYLQGCLLALSDWERDPQDIISSLRQLEVSLYKNQRFSKHGRYFVPFFESLHNSKAETEINEDNPLFLSIPFLDWTTNGPTPELRFQVDPREGYHSSRLSSHPLRSILQYFYRLEDTNDRESHQVFSKHKPWSTDRSLDLKVRRWYGTYPTGLNVDELWVLMIDSRHIITFSSNQTWKSRWPPMQLASRIAEVSFRGIRNNFLSSEKTQDYTSVVHMIAVLNGAIGILHRSFWTDLVLCLTDRYAGYIGHLQYRLHRAPSTKLVMDLLQVQDELNIIIQIIEQQIKLITDLQSTYKGTPGRNRSQSTNSVTSDNPQNKRHSNAILHPFRATFRQYSFSTLSDPMSQLLENLEREYVDLRELRENCNRLVDRTVQLVNIRLEDHGKAILVFTIITLIFLPLSFVTSFFGMNVSDIRDLDKDQRIFWTVAGSLTAGVVGLAIFIAFYGPSILERFIKWQENRTIMMRNQQSNGSRRVTPNSSYTNFEILDRSPRMTDL